MKKYCRYCKNLSEIPVTSKLYNEYGQYACMLTETRKMDCIGYISTIYSADNCYIKNKNMDCTDYDS